MPDIDIDFANRDVVLSKIQHRVAKLDTGKKHNTGVYVTECPHNPVDNLSTIDYKTAEDRGYFKLDFLNVSIYNDVKAEAHLQQLMEKEPQCDLLEHDDYQLAVSRQRTWGDTKKAKAEISGTTSSSVSDNTTCEEASCQRNLANDTNRRLAKTQRR